MADQTKDSQSIFYSASEQRELIKRYIPEITNLDNIPLFRMAEPFLESSPYDPHNIPKPGSEHPSKKGFIALATETYSVAGDNSMATIYFSPNAINGKPIDSRGEVIVAGLSQQLLSENRKKIAAAQNQSADDVADVHQTLSNERVFAAIRFSQGIGSPETEYAPSSPTPSKPNPGPNDKIKRAIQNIDFRWNTYESDTSAYRPSLQRSGNQIEV